MDSSPATSPLPSRPMAGLMLECSARSDVGRRPNNEDAVFASPRLAAVADGVGGAAAGGGGSPAPVNPPLHVGKSWLGGARGGGPAPRNPPRHQDDRLLPRMPPPEAREGS